MSINTRTTSRHLAVLLVLLGLPPALGNARQQTPPAAPDAAAIKQSLAANQAALKKYSWVETTVVLLKGEVKKQEQKQCAYGADGKVQKTPLPGAPAPQASSSGGGGRGGRVGKAVVANKVEDTKEYMEKVAALVHEYVPPDPAKIQAAQTAGTVSVAPSGALTTMTVKNYVKEGDVLSLGFDTAAKAIRSYNVQSYVEKPKDDAVTLTVTFATLDDGTSYPQNVVLDVAAKKIQVKVTNGGYKK